ncbi:hypothetical protein B0J17DRAFT_652364 [Rhizoctonia solani]|nr:hypothetical protein B0J17DRAFT_652364 [Rhizoctonia solani]
MPTSTSSDSDSSFPLNAGFQDAGDFTLKSSPNDVEFKVFRLFLMTASPVFQDILTSGLGPPVMELSEDAETITALLQYIYPCKNLVIKDYELLTKVLEAARKYKLGFITSDLCTSMRLDSSSPPNVCPGVHHELKEEIPVAAKLTIGKYDFASREGASELCALNIPSKDAIMLMHLHMARTAALLDLLINTNSNTRYFAGFPVKCLTCKPSKSGSMSELQRAWMKEVVHLLQKEPLDKVRRLFDREFFLGLKLQCTCMGCHDSEMYDMAHKAWAEESREKLAELKLDDL